MEYKAKLNIKDWAEADRPREKMMSKGVSSLSDAEILAILIGSGNKDETAVELSQRILHSVKNNLNALGRLEVNDLTKNFYGIGEAKAITIIAALELGRRYQSSETIVQPQINTSRDVYNIFHPMLNYLKHEEVWILLLSRSNKVIKKIQLSKGGISGSVIDIRMIMKEGVEALASGLILCHNHPSNNNEPSREDDTITTTLKEAGDIMNIKLLDHVIVCDGTYYSYADKNRL